MFNDSDNMHPTMQIFSGILLLLISLCGGACSYTQIEQASSSTKWPTTSGVVEEAKLREIESRKTGISSWAVDLRYSYTVDGKPYECEKIKPGDMDSYISKPDAETALKKYAPATTQQVFYNPKDPANAYLEPGFGSSWGSIAMWCGLTILMLFMGGKYVSRGIQRLREGSARERPMRSVAARLAAPWDRWLRHHG